MTTQNTIDENKRIVRAFIETAFNQHQADRAAQYMTPDIKWHGGTLGTIEGRENFVGLIGAIVSALPDLHNVEQDIIAERDIVSVRAVVDATHKGNLLGIPASGRHVRWDAVDVYRVVDGKIAEEWAADDLLAFVYGVGAYTPPWLSQQSQPRKLSVLRAEVARLLPGVQWSSGSRNLRVRFGLADEVSAALLVIDTSHHSSPPSAQ